ncbi:hypothetical protein GCM10018781_34420 [Kitasatospora indigofera]|uniref:Uncharacterized protein n=1 Tax=Kitasatospora indigofera TaxID=67307 RepID=A0A919FUD3_9ACTN|nr:hypothetical protein [Kitasatospora indigofera]GHH72106.1 hypothetical protein GCM10018781_34420 [Kitasatospora indigofera]
MSAHRVPTEVPTQAQIDRTSRTISGFTWLLTGAVVTVSMSTAAPFIDAHSPGWGTGPIMALGTDGCFILSLQSDGTLARYGVGGGRWPAAFRWVTGLATVWLNIGAAALTKDLVGVVVHLIPPLLLLLVAEAGPAYRRALAHLAHRPANEVEQTPVGPLREPVDTPLPTFPQQVPTPLTGAGWGQLPQSVSGVWKGPKQLSAGPVSTPAAHRVFTTPAGVPTPTAHPVPEPLLEPVQEPSETVSGGPVGTKVPAGEQAAPTDPNTPPTEVPTDDTEESEAVPAGIVRLGEAEAAAVIEECWREGVSQREAARRATRAPSLVGRIYKRLDAERVGATA